MPSKTQWKYGLKGARSVSQRRPVITGNTVLATFNHGQGANLKATLCAIDFETGDEQWRFDAKLILNEPSVSQDGHIFITCFDGSITKLRPDGTLCWTVQPSCRNLWTGIVVKDKFFYAEIGGRAKYTRALDVEDGAVVWEYENGGHAYALGSDGGQRIVHCSVAGRIKEKQIYLHCLEASSGHVIWQHEYKQYLFQPLIIESYIVIGSRNHIALFDLTTGDLLSTHTIEAGIAVTANPIVIKHGVGENRIVLLTEKGRLFCVDMVTSQLTSPHKIQLKQQWSRDFPCGIEAKVVLQGDVLLAIAEDGNLLKIRHDTGETIGQIKLPGFKTGYGVSAIGNDLIVAVSRYCTKLR